MLIDSTRALLLRVVYMYLAAASASHVIIHQLPPPTHPPIVVMSTDIEFHYMKAAYSLHIAYTPLFYAVIINDCRSEGSDSSFMLLVYNVI